MQVPHGLPSVEGGEEWAEIRVERKQRRRVCMYESFMIGKQETESVVKYSTAGLRNSEIADETRVRWFCIRSQTQKASWTVVCYQISKSETFNLSSNPDQHMPASLPGATPA